MTDYLKRIFSQLVAGLLAQASRLVRLAALRQVLEEYTAALEEAAQLEARSHHDVIDRLPRITAPTLVASGRFDGIAPVANGEVIAAAIPGAELRVYDGGHVFMMQDPRATPEIIGFLAA